MYSNNGTRRERHVCKKNENDMKLINIAVFCLHFRYELKK